MNTYDSQLNRYLEWMIYLFHKHEKMDVYILTLEHFMSQGRPLEEQYFRLIERDFVRLGTLDTKPFWVSKYVD